MVAMLLSGAWLLQRPPASGLPELRLPAPVPERALHGAAGAARVTLRDVRFRVAATQTEIVVPLVELRPVIPDLSRPISMLQIESVRIVQLRAVAPIDTIITPIDAFTPIPGPRLRIGRVSLVDADIGELADPRLGYGRWFYHATDVDLEIRDIDVAGRRATPERLRIERMDLGGEVRGDRFAITRLAADIARVPALFDLQLAAAFGLTALTLQTRFTPADEFTLDVRADTVRFAELRAFESSLPREGTGKFDVSAARGADSGYVLFRRATAQFGVSHVSVQGQLQDGTQPGASALTVRLSNIRPEDVQRAFGVELPGDGPYNGQFFAQGDLRSGLRVNGDVRGSAAGAPSHLALNGTLRADPDAMLDVQLIGNPLRLADTAFTLNLRATGPLDTLAIRGVVQLGPGAQVRAPVVASVQPAPPVEASRPAAYLDLQLLSPGDSTPRRLVGRTTLHANGDTRSDGTRPVHALAQGAIIFGKEARVDARISADSLPLDVLPWPAELDSVRGFARGAGQVLGALKDPAINGVLALHGGRAHVRTVGLTASAIEGSIQVCDNRLSTDSITARVLDGQVRVRGNAVLAHDGALDLDVTMDSLPVAGFRQSAQHIDDLRGHVRGRVNVRGTFDDPKFGGRAHLVNAAGRVRATGMEVERLNGMVYLEQDRIRTNGIRGRAGPGTVSLSGMARWGERPQLLLELHTDSARVVDTDSASLLATSDLTITGTPKEPHLGGRVRLVGGWAKEDLMKSNPVIDPDDPPYQKLAARAPWIRNSRLRAAQARSDGPPFRGRVTLEITPAIKVIDEDSELIGHGEVVITADSTGLHPSGGVRFLRGYYANFGERFLVWGGGHRFSNGEIRLALRADHDVDPLNGRDQGSAAALEWYPGVEIFVLGSAATASEELRRNVPLPESPTQLAARLLFGEPIEPISGWSNPRFWLPDQPSNFFGKRAEQQGSTLLWDYSADEAYDYLPLSRISLQGGTVTVGSRFPGRIVQGPLFRVGLNVTRHLNLQANLAPEGSAAPGLRARWRNGGMSFSVFDEPKFYADSPGSDGFPGYFFRRRTGIGLRWDREF
jgi:hypothetical protein